MATISMERVEELVSQSAQRVGGRVGMKFSPFATFSDDMLTVEALIVTNDDDGKEKHDRFKLPGSNLRLAESALVRLLDSHFELLARRFWR